MNHPALHDSNAHILWPDLMKRNQLRKTQSLLHEVVFRIERCMFTGKRRQRLSASPPQPRSALQPGKEIAKYLARDTFVEQGVTKRPRVEHSLPPASSQSTSSDGNPNAAPDVFTQLLNPSPGLLGPWPVLTEEQIAAASEPEAHSPMLGPAEISPAQTTPEQESPERVSHGQQKPLKRLTKRIAPAKAPVAVSPASSPAQNPDRCIHALVCAILWEISSSAECLCVLQTFITSSAGN